MKKVAHLWSIMCRNSIVDGETNNLSLLNIIEELRITTERVEMLAQKERKAIPIEFEVVTSWRKLLGREKSVSGKAKIELIDPLGKLLHEAFYEVLIKENIERLRSRARYNGFLITVPGEYTFKILLQEEGQKDFSEVGRIQLNLKQAVEISKKMK